MDFMLSLLCFHYGQHITHFALQSLALKQCLWFSPRHAGSFLLLTCSEIKLSGAILHLFCLHFSTVTVYYLQIWAVTSFAGLDLSTQPLLQSFISSIWGYFQIQSDLFYCYILAIIYLLWVCGIIWLGAFSNYIRRVQLCLPVLHMC